MTTLPDKTLFAPGHLVDHGGGRYSLVFSDFPSSPELDAVYEEHGLQGGGHTWTGLVVHLLQTQAPAALEALDFDPEGSMFAVVSTDLTALQHVARALAELQQVAVVKRLASTVDLSEYD